MVLTSILLFYMSDSHATGLSGVSFLKIGAGARATAMGEATVALAPDASMLFWNPGTLPLLAERQAHLTYNQWIQDVDNHIMAAVFPSEWGTFGIGAIHTQVTELEHRRTATENPLGTFSAHDFTLGVSYGRSVGKKLSLGVYVKYLYEKIYLETAHGVALDAGLCYQLGIKGLTVGASLQNVGFLSKLKDENISLPETIRAGFGYAIPMEWLDGELTAAIDMVSVLGESSHLNMGADLRIFSLLAFRAGYQTGYEERNITAGFGLLFGSFLFDYSYVPFRSDIGQSQRFSISFLF